MPSLDIDTAFIERLAELLQRTGLTEIEVSQADTRLRIVKQPPVVEHVAMPAALTVTAAAQAPPAIAPTADAPQPGDVNSPMVGTVYLYPEPGAAPFISPGAAVREGQTLLIIEAMKVMNAIRAPRAGRVTRILVENAAPVEYGEPLLTIEP